jgi:hypothetical protein
MEDGQRDKPAFTAFLPCDVAATRLWTLLGAVRVLCPPIVISDRTGQVSSEIVRGIIIWVFFRCFPKHDCFMNLFL